MLGTFPDTSQARRIVIDCETHDPLLKTKGMSYIYDTGYILGIGIKLDNSYSMYYPLSHDRGENYNKTNVFDYIRNIPDTAYVIGHYCIYDSAWIYHEIGKLFNNAKCTLLMAQLENNSRPSYSLDGLCKLFQLGKKIDIDINDLSNLSINEVARYCCHDVDLTAHLDDKLWQYRDTDASRRECGIIPILVKMKNQGIKVDVKRLMELESYYRSQLYREMAICGTQDIWASARIVEIFDELGLKYPLTKATKTYPGGQPSFQSWFLESIDHPRIKSLHRARQLHKLLNFCDQIKEHLTSNNRIHADFMNGRSEFGGTITGRFSSAHPNLQQIPHRTDDGKLLRSIFIPDDGHVLFKMDFRQQEPMLMLHYASKLGLRDIETWQEYYKSPDADFYSQIQTKMNISRFEAKTYSLARSYNMGPEKLSQRAHISLHEAMDHLINFDNNVPWLKQLKEHCTKTVMNRGYIKTIGDRKLYLTRQNASDSFNHLIQGSAADQIKEAMYQIYQQLHITPLLQVHDELLFQLNHDQINHEMDKDIQVIMEDAIELDFPTRIEMGIGKNWLQCDEKNRFKG